MNRLARTMGVVILVASMCTLGGIAPVTAAGPVPKVALVVGPAGSVTSTYRLLADEAAAAARAAGAEVVKVYSPNATWAAVERALTGASVVVYLGHGNGWPSRYRDALYPPTQNGFGLNPVAGGGDAAHQYFGEAFVEDLQLARNAVVVLSHLCYASGNTEPGLSQGTRSQAIQRVDNYAAGFLRAGARAVVAEGHLGPAYYVRSLLTSGSSIERIWERSPSAHGNTFSVESTRSSGFMERLDPDRTDGGYYRSLVSAGLEAPVVRAGATGVVGVTSPRPPSEPTLATLDLRFGTVALRSLPIAATTTTLTLPLPKAGVAKLPKGMLVGVRWNPVFLDPQPIGPPVDRAAAAPGSSPDPGPSSSPPPSSSPSSSPSPDRSPASSGASPTPSPVAAAATPGASEASAEPSAPPAIEVVVPEETGSVVTPAKARYTSKGLVLNVDYPTAPGLYRLVPTLHTASGVAYDVATQDLLRPVLVRVGGRVGAAFGVTAGLSIRAGESTELGVRVMNTGIERWDLPVSRSRTVDADQAESPGRQFRVPPQLVATWISVSEQAVPPRVATILSIEAATPGGQEAVRLPLSAPTVPGEYLLLLDVASPSQGSIVAHGGVPTLVRVTVTEAIPPTTTAEAGPTDGVSPAPARRPDPTGRDQAGTLR